MTFLDKADIVVDKENRFLHSVSKIYPWPSVIRLKRFVRLPYKDIILTRKNVLRRDKHKCAYCGRGDLPLTLDHIVPKAKGGNDSWDNLVAACMPCNNKKGDRTPTEASLILKVKPYKPSFLMFIINSVSRIDENWKPFLYHAR